MEDLYLAVHRTLARLPIHLDAEWLATPNCFVYFLYEASETLADGSRRIVYVGKTIRGAGRLKNHFSYDSNLVGHVGRAWDRKTEGQSLFDGHAHIYSTFRLRLLPMPDEEATGYWEKRLIATLVANYPGCASPRWTGHWWIPQPELRRKPRREYWPTCTGLWNLRELRGVPLYSWSFGEFERIVQQRLPRQAD